MFGEEGLDTVNIPVHPKDVEVGAFTPTLANHAFMDVALCTCLNWFELGLRIPAKGNFTFTAYSNTQYFQFQLPILWKQFGKGPYMGMTVRCPQNFGRIAHNVNLGSFAPRSFVTSVLCALTKSPLYQQFCFFFVLSLETVSAMSINSCSTISSCLG